MTINEKIIDIFHDVFFFTNQRSNVNVRETYIICMNLLIKFIDLKLKFFLSNIYLYSIKYYLLRIFPKLL